jgi:RNA polymerase sigma-70 factor (ECF subfamily)
MRASLPLDTATEFASVFRDEEAFRRWYDEVAPRIYAYLFGRCGANTDLAQELTQQTFIQAIRHRDDYLGRADSVTWLVAIARSRLVDHFRRLEREGRRQLRLVREIAPEDIDAAAWRANDDRSQIQAAMRHLAPDQRAALVLRYLDGLPVKEVAQAMGRSEKAVEAVITRARQAFRAEYKDPDRG